MSAEIVTIILQGTFAARPAAADALEYYVTTGANAGKRYWSDGSTWFEQPPEGGAPTTADYLVGTAQAGLSAEIVVGASPGGELGGTWAAPTVDATHSGSTHAAAQAAAEATAAAALSAHDADTTAVHGIANTANLYASGGTDVAVTDGGTGSSTAAGARTNLGLVIGTDVAAFAAAASQAEAEAGSEAALRAFSPLRVAQAIAALATGGTGNVATDTIWDAAGDLAQGTGSNAAARLAAGTAGHVLTSAGAAAPVVWAAPSSALASARVALTTSDLTTASTTFVDATGMSTAITTGAHSVLICVTAVSEINTAPNDICLDIDVDGARLGGSFGLSDFQHNATARRANMSFCVSSAALSAASHTFKLQWRVTGGTGTLYRSTTIPLIMTVVELPA